MARPKKHRVTKCDPASYYFKPRGIPILDLEEIELYEDELESIKLADLDSFSHEDAAKKMKVSRATFGRIVKSARRKIVDGFINGKAIKIRNKKQHYQ